MEIRKYVLTNEEYQNVLAPINGKPLCVQVQGDKVCLWMAVEPQEYNYDYEVRILNTGEPFEGFVGNYVGSYQLFDGSYVGHVFIKA